jgi:hypothetical protein
VTDNGVTTDLANSIELLDDVLADGVGDTSRDDCRRAGREETVEQQVVLVRDDQVGQRAHRVEALHARHDGAAIVGEPADGHLFLATPACRADRPGEDREVDGARF